MLAVPATAAFAGSKHPKGGGTTTTTTTPSPAPTSTAPTTTTTTSTTTAPAATVPTYANVGSVSAHLRLTITTTSDWTAVAFTPGKVTAAHVTSLTGTATETTLANGVKLDGATGTTTAVVDAVFYEPSGAANIGVTVTKGLLGQTTLKIENSNAATPVVVLPGFTDSVQSATSPTNPASTTVTRSNLFTATPMPQPHADARRLTLAFYYPWYASYTDPTLADVPQNQRTSWDAAGVSSMTAQAKANGVNGFVVSYAGDASDGPGFDAARRAAEAQGQYVTGYLEIPRATSATSGTNADPNVVRDWLVQLLRRKVSPAFLTASDGVPVVFVYGMGRLLPRHWDAIQTNLRDVYGLSVHLVGDDTDAAYLPYEYGLHRYAVLDSGSSLAAWSQETALTSRGSAVVDPAAAAKLYVGTTSPGFDDTKLRGATNPVIPRDGTSRYDDTWAAARAGSPDWVVVSTWNEWYEDSQIEPGVATGSQALTDTATQAAAFRAAG